MTIHVLCANLSNILYPYHSSRDKARYKRKTGQSKDRPLRKVKSLTLLMFYLSIILNNKEIINKRKLHENTPNSFLST